MLNIADVIAAILKGNPTEKQKADFDSWYAASARNRELYDRICSEFSEEVVHIEAFPVEKSWDELVHTLGIEGVSSSNQPKIRPLYTKLLRYAAVLVLPVALAALIGYMSHRPKTMSMELMAEFTKPYLTEQTLLINSKGEAMPINSSFEKDAVDGVEKILPNIISYKTSEKADRGALNRIIVPRGKTLTVQLSDGSSVRLNSESELIFPAHFTGDSRVVALKGEGYFSVSKNPDAPFTVKTASYSIKVLGTEFNVAAYTNESTTTTTLCSGHVSIEGLMGQKGSVELRPGQQLSENRETGRYTKASVDTQPYTSWIENRFTFDKVPFSTIIKTLERAYNVKFVYEETDFTSGLYSCSMVRYADVQKCLEILEYGNQITVTRNQSTIYIKKKR